jgi:cytochrome oxidase Cu insertion factor (SCO1/SenC/PrrC family)
MPAPDGQVLTVDGLRTPLSRFTRERITLLGFIYTTCIDPEGCPLAYQVFYRLRDEIQATPALADKVQLVSLSFDPARDSPAAMKHYAGRILEEEGGVRWYFLTTARWGTSSRSSRASARTCATRWTGRAAARCGSFPTSSRSS